MPASGCPSATGRCSRPIIAAMSLAALGSSRLRSVSSRLRARTTRCPRRCASPCYSSKLARFCVACLASPPNPRSPSPRPSPINCWSSQVAPMKRDCRSMRPCDFSSTATPTEFRTQDWLPPCGYRFDLQERARWRCRPRTQKIDISCAKPSAPEAMDCNLKENALSETEH